ncbi:MAG: Fe-Mn family superoxide dismutase [Bacteriovoracaceae bacterium]
MFELEKFNYEKLSKLNFISDETVDFHVYHHHLGYVKNLNNLLEINNELKGLTLEKIIKTYDGAIFNNAAQIWNHSFYWHCISTSLEQKKISSVMEDVLIESFKSIENFYSEFKRHSLKFFGSGWCWLVHNLEDNKLIIMTTSNADIPFRVNSNFIPVLVCDLWEHAYYIDYRNRKDVYVGKFLENINWSWVEECMG